MPLLSWFRSGPLRDAIRARYADSGAERYAISFEQFSGVVEAVFDRYAPRGTQDERVALFQSLHVHELVLARACTAGNDLAWHDFLARYRSELYRAAAAIARDDAAGRDLADELHAELYGLPNQAGRRVSKLDYYMGRGSLAGWLRTVLAQKHIDRCRAAAHTVSLEEEIETGSAFAAPPPANTVAPADSVANVLAATLTECPAEERFLLASYYLDGRTLAQIARQLGVHESTVSRRLDRLTSDLRSRVRRRLLSSGIHPQRCDEMLTELDVRDLNVDVAATLRQEKQIGTF